MKQKKPQAYKQRLFKIYNAIVNGTVKNTFVFDTFLKNPLYH